MPDSDRLPKIALIGCGLWGRHLARNLAALGCLGGIADPDSPHAKAAAAEFGCPLITAGAAIADAAMDGLAIATPPRSHAALAIAGLEAGKAVYVEKPLALSLAEAEAIAAAAGFAPPAASRAFSERARGAIIMVGHLLRHHPVFARLLEMVRGGAIGTLRHIRCCRLAPGRVRDSESAVYDLACHDLAMVAALTENAPPQHITAHGASHITKGIADHVAAQINFADGVVATLEAGWYYPEKTHHLTVIGSKAALVFDDCRPWGEKLVLHGFAVGDDLAIDNSRCETIPVPESEPLRAEMQNFIDGITGQAAILTDMEEALYVQRIMDDIEKAITGKDA